MTMTEAIKSSCENSMDNALLWFSSSPDVPNAILKYHRSVQLIKLCNTHLKLAAVNKLQSWLWKKFHDTLDRITSDICCWSQSSVFGCVVFTSKRICCRFHGRTLRPEFSLQISCVGNLSWLHHTPVTMCVIQSAVSFEVVWTAMNTVTFCLVQRR